MNSQIIIARGKQVGDSLRLRLTIHRHELQALASEGYVV
jgi:hypothetical protein